MTVIHLPRHRPASASDFTDIDTEALVRFAAEFLYRVAWNEATPAGMERAYVDTMPPECGGEALYGYMQELGQQVYGALREDFRIWASRGISWI
jgi:hypothetical protein